jgi:hypothetical protein
VRFFPSISLLIALFNIMNPPIKIITTHFLAPFYLSPTNWRKIDGG